MMVETILESPADLGMSNGTVPQWKRELLQRRATRAPPAPRTPPPPPAAPPAVTPLDDEELRYGPGIVKRLKSRYLSLALREAPRRRPSVLRRAASLEHLQPAAPRRPRPVSAALPAPPAADLPRRDAVKRARSVDALARLDSRETPVPAPVPVPVPVAPTPAPAPPRAPPPPPALPPAPIPPRAPRPPRRPAPLLRDTERPPPDVVRAALLKFESGGGCRRSTPAARVSGAARVSDDDPERRPVSRAALDNIARAGHTQRFTFACRSPPSASNPVLLERAAGSPRRVGVIKPMQHEAPRTPSPRPCPDPPAAESTPVVAVTKPPAPPPEAVLTGPVKMASPEAARTASRISSARIERVLSSSGGGRGRPESGATSIVFNFSSRKEVPDYIENDGLILKAARRDKLKASDSGVVLLRPPAGTGVGAGGGTDSDEEEVDGERPVSPTPVRFLNDNVLINGRSSLTHVRTSRRNNKLKLQFDDSLTVTFEYPSETSLHDDLSLSPTSPTDTESLPEGPGGPGGPGGPVVPTVPAVPVSLSSYRPSKSAHAPFCLGLAPPTHTHTHTHNNNHNHDEHNNRRTPDIESLSLGEPVEESETADVTRAGCSEGARSFSHARLCATDLLF